MELGRLFGYDTVHMWSWAGRRLPAGGLGVPDIWLMLSEEVVVVGNPRCAHVSGECRYSE